MSKKGKIELLDISRDLIMEAFAKIGVEGQRLIDSGELTPDEAIDLLQQVTDGISHAVKQAKMLNHLPRQEQEELLSDILERMKGSGVNPDFIKKYGLDQFESKFPKKSPFSSYPKHYPNNNPKPDDDPYNHT